MLFRSLEIHVRISSPPVKWPCYYGIDFATRAELIAAGLETEEIRRSIGADSLGYVSMDGLVKATNIAKEKLCTACFTGDYPIQIPTDLSAGKHLLQLSYKDSFWLPGANVREPLGPVYLTQETAAQAKVFEFTKANSQKLCGMNVDWLAWKVS